MSKIPDNLPFIPDHENWIYILNEDDRQKFEPVQQGDECWQPSAKVWRPTMLDAGDTFFVKDLYRRRKTSGWVSVKERLPEANTPFYATNGKYVTHYIYGWIAPDRLSNSDFTHWQPWTLPALPQPPKPAAEVAFEEWCNNPNFAPDLKEASRKAWFTAIAWAKANKGEL